MAMCFALMFGRLGSVAGSSLTAILLEKRCQSAFYTAGFSLIGKTSCIIDQPPRLSFLLSFPLFPHLSSSLFLSFVQSISLCLKFLSISHLLLCIFQYFFTISPRYHIFHFKLKKFTRSIIKWPNIFLCLFTGAAFLANFIPNIHKKLAT